MRRAVASNLKNRSKTKTLPAANRGWILNENLAMSGPGGAYVMENIFPTLTGWRVRGGNIKHATIGTDPVLRMFTYKKGAAETFFASDETNVFEISTPADPDVAPTADITGQTSGYYSDVQMGTVGGEYLYLFNGDDDPQLYDGTSWMAVTAISTPAITGVTAADLIYGWVFASRMFMIEKGTLSTWYLPVDSIGGAAQEFSLDGVFHKGGELVFGSTWSLDSGDGLDDKCVFVSNQGEVAVYQGTNPGAAADWSKVGVYQITKPMGANAHIKAGGDLLISTEDGIVPLTEVLQKDVAALSLSAVSRAIQPEWEAQVAARRSLPWELVKFASKNMLIASLPVVSTATPSECLVANLETGAWCKFTGWDTRSLAIYNNGGYFGTNDGTIHSIDVGGSDDGTSYVCKYVGLPDHLGSVGVTKTVHSARSVFIATSPFIPKISMSVNYQVNLPAAPNSIADYVVDEWDAGLWDVALWDGSPIYSVTTKWVSIGKTGFTVLPEIQITCGVTPLPRIEFVAFDLVYENAGVMV